MTTKIVEILPVHVKLLWGHMQSVFGSSVHYGPGIRSAVTIGTHIVLPYDPGKATADWPLWMQLKNAVHEHQHLVQFRQGPVGFAVRYLLSATARGAYEAEAYVCDMEMDWFHLRSLVLPQFIEGRMAGYLISEEDKQVARQILELAATSIQAGGIMTEAFKVARDFLVAEWPELQATF